MSEFLAEARIRVVPDTTRFRAQLQEEVTRAVSQARIPPIAVPITATGTGLAGIAAATTGLAASQEAAAKTTLGLASAAQLENTAFGRQAVILNQTTIATERKAGADVTAAAAARAHARNVTQVEKAAFASSASLAGLRGAVLTAGTAFLGATVAFQAFGQSVAAAAELERTLNVFRATAGATADEMARVAQEARALGADISLPAVSASDAAVAMTELAKAGLSVQDSLEGARGVLQLATAAQIDNARASELVANALNTFDLAGEEATRVADLLAGASIQAQGSIEDMGLAFRQVAAVAELVGLSIEDTVTLITALAQSGLQGSDAGTSLRVSLLRLVNPAGEAAKAVDQLDLNLRDFQGNLRPQVFAEIGAQLRGLPPATRQATIAMLGGQDAVRSFGQLADFTSEELEALETNITKSGLAAELAGAQTEGLTGDLEGLKNEASATGITIGQLSSPILSGLADSARGVFRSINLITEGVRAVVAPTRAARSDFAELRDEFIDARNDLQRFKESTDNDFMPPALINRVKDARKALEEFGGAARVARGDVTIFDVTLQGVQSTLDNLAAELRNFSARATAGGGATGLNVQQILNRVSGFDEAEVQARIRDDTSALLGVLQEEQAFLEQQLSRAAVQRREPLRRRLKDALLGVINDISAIQRESAGDARSAVQDAARAQKEADDALLDLLSSRRDDAARRAAAASQTTGLSDDIRAQERIQALIKIQIAKIRAQIKDEQARKDAIRELRIALIASRQEEDALRKERAAAASARKDEIQNLNIQIAEERGNKTAIERAIQTRIDTLNKQIKAAKGDQVKMKQLILERERLKNQLEELNKQEADSRDQGKTAAQSFFEFLQTQQGFAANLLGNLIPGFATGGLVGGGAGQTTARQVPSDIGVGVRQQGVLQAAEARGVRPVQVDTTNALLRQILATLQGRQTTPPEVDRNRRSGSAVIDYL